MHGQTEIDLLKNLHVSISCSGVDGLVLITS